MIFCLIDYGVMTVIFLFEDCVLWHVIKIEDLRISLYQICDLVTKPIRISDFISDDISPSILLI